MLHKKNKKVIIGISGGVDSSVSAWILKKQGYQVEGLFMKNWEEDDNDQYCNSQTDLADAQSVCEQLGIKLHIINFSAEYWDNVFVKFLIEYQSGRTPNPDVLCNKEIKFKIFMQHAIENLEADFISTGHYVRHYINKNQSWLLRGVDYNKDQSYFLYTLNYRQLRQCLFPIGTLIKSQVRNIATQLNLITAKKKDSTGICFIGKRNFFNFLSRYLPIQPGPIIAVNGQHVGNHQGLMYYTIGQRKGLKIGGISKGNGKPWRVVDKDLKNNLLIVVQGHDDLWLLSDGIVVNQLHFIDNYRFKYPLYCTVKTRYRQPDMKCKIKPQLNNSIQVMFENPLTAVTPGQSAVFYLEECCLGGGIIETRSSVLKDYSSRLKSITIKNKK